REVHLLKPFAVAHVAVHVTHEEDHRARILESYMDPDAGIGCTWAAGDEAYARPTRHRPIGAGHEGRAAFLPARHCLDGPGIMQGIEHREKTFAGNGEDAVAALAD